MFRLPGPSRAIREAVPPELVPVFWAITALGSAKLLLLGLSLAYWNLDSRREAVLRVVGVAFVALTVTLVLKYWFALPRPPEAVRRYPIEPSPVGFPSGHAIAGTVVYGGIVVVLDRLRDPRAVAGAATVALLVGLSRVVLGVHYLGDVLAGFAVGLVVLAGVALVDADARVLFATAAALSVPALVVTDLGPDAVFALGGSIGALAGVVWTGDVRPLTPRRRWLLTLAGVVVVAVGLGLVELVESILPLALAVHLLLVFGIVALPDLLERVVPATPRQT